MDIQLPDMNGIDAFQRLRAGSAHGVDPRDRGFGIGDARGAKPHRRVGV